MTLKKSELAAAIKPFVLGWIGAMGGAVGDQGYAPSPHDLNSAHHSGSLADAQAPQFLKTDGSRSLLGNLAVADTITIDGVDISVLNSNFSTHDAGTAAGQHDGGVGIHTHRTNPEGGLLDHGAALSGLGDDDHTIYASAEGSGTRRAYEAGRLNKSILVGNGLTGGGLLTADRTLAVGLAAAWSGLEFDAGDLRIDQDAAFTWTAQHIFNAGARIAAGQSLQFGTDVALSRAGADVLGLASGDAFRSTSYASGISGWAIDADGDAEFNNVRVRGALTTAVFIKGLIEARAGSELITKSAGILSDDMAVPGSGTWYAYVEDPPGGGFLFEDGDICQCKTEYASGVGAVWFTLSARTDAGDGRQRYTCTYASGTRSITYPAGAPIVDYGVSGDGGLLLTADDAVGNAPFLSVFTHAGSPWSTLTEHLRLGNLNGLGDYSADAYGVFVGNYAGNKWLAYDPTNSLRIRGDALIDGTVTADKLQIGDHGLFSLTGGLLLLGPGCELVNPYWYSQRRQRGTINGAFHTVQSRWAGHRGIIMEPTCTSYCYNGAMRDNDFSNRADNWSMWETVSGAPTESVVAHPLYGWMQRAQYTSSSDTGGIIVYQYQTAAASFAAGDACAFSLDVKGNLVGCTAYVDILAYDSGNNLLGNTTAKAVTFTSSLSRVFTVYSTLPASTNYVICRIYVNNIDTGDTVDAYFGAANIEKTVYPTSFCCGLLDWCSWSGTEYASTSTRAATYLGLGDYKDLISGKNQLTFTFRVRASYDYNTTYAPDWWYLMGPAGAAGHNIALYFHRPSGLFYANVNGTNMQCSSVTFSKGDELHVVFTLDFAADQYRVYVNGTMVLDDTTSLSAPTIDGSWRVGGSSGGTAQGGWVFSEYAVMGVALTQEDVCRFYNLGIPLVDNGAMETPGIYILDGKFRVASSVSGVRSELTAPGLGVYGGSGVSSIGRLLVGILDTSSKALSESGDSAGIFGYDASDVLQAAWYGLGANAGKIFAAGGALKIDSEGITIAPGIAFDYGKSYKFSSDQGDFGLSGYKTGMNAHAMKLEIAPLSGNASIWMTSSVLTGSDALVKVAAENAWDSDEVSLTLSRPDSGASTCKLLNETGDVELQVGDAAGSNYVGVLDSAAALVGRIDSDGHARLLGGLGVGSVTRSPPAGTLVITDGVSAPSAISGGAIVYVDSATGDLMVRFGDGTIKTIVADT